MPSEKSSCLSGTGLTKVFGSRRTRTVAVDHVDFDFHEGEVVSIVGESGSGKTTLAKMLLGLTKITKGDGWESERTGLHEREFIETERHWFSKPVSYPEHDGVQVFNVIEGREILVESPTGFFSPMVFHYAETFIVPAAAGAIKISPYGESEGKKCGTIKAFVRT